MVRILCRIKIKAIRVVVLELLPVRSPGFIRRQVFVPRSMHTCRQFDPQSLIMRFQRIDFQCLGTSGKYVSDRTTRQRAFAAEDKECGCNHRDLPPSAVDAKVDDYDLDL